MPPDRFLLLSRLLNQFGPLKQKLQGYHAYRYCHIFDASTKKHECRFSKATRRLYEQQGEAERLRDEMLSFRSTIEQMEDEALEPLSKLVDHVLVLIS